MSKHRQQYADESDTRINLNQVTSDLYGALPDETADSRPNSSATVALTSGQDGTLSVGAFHITRKGLILERAVSEAEWVGFFTAINQIQQAIQWVIGDWLVYGETTFAKTREEIAKLTGYKRGTLDDFAYVSAKVGFSIRIEKLHWGHHQVVASLSPPDQKAWLEYALEQNLSVQALRDEISGSPKKRDEDPLGVANFRRNAGAIARVAEKAWKVGAVSRHEAEEAVQQIEAMREWLFQAEQAIKEKRR